MPYMIVKRGNKFAVHKRGTDSHPEGSALGTHSKRIDAERHKRTLDVAVEHDDGAAKYAAVDFKPTEAMSLSAAKGIKLSESTKGTPKKAKRVGLLIAARRPLSIRTIKQLNRFFTRTDDNGRCEGWGDELKPAVKWVSYLMYGGDGGRVWARGCRDQMARIDEDKPVMQKTLNTSNAGSVGNAVEQSIEKKPSTPEEDTSTIFSYIPAKYNLDEVVVVKSLNVAGVITGVERKKNGAVMYSLSINSGGMAICSTPDLERVSATTKSAIKKQIYQVQLKMLAARARFLLAQLSYDRPVKPVDYYRLLKSLNKMAKHKELPYVKRPRFTLARKKLQAAYILSRRNPEDNGLFNLISSVVGALTKLSKSSFSVRAMPTEKDVIKSFNNINGGIKSLDTELLQDNSEVDGDTPLLAEKNSAIKSLQECAQKYVKSFEHKPTTKQFEDALDEMYLAAENVSNGSIDPATYKGAVEAVYAEVDAGEAKEWAQEILDSFPEVIPEAI